MLLLESVLPIYRCGNRLTVLCQYARLLAYARLVVLAVVGGRPKKRYRRHHDPKDPLVDYHHFHADHSYRVNHIKFETFPLNFKLKNLAYIATYRGHGHNVVAV